MLKRKGSVLAITIGFSLIFTMLGTASIYMSTLQSETQEKKVLNQQAFWLAEAGINKAIALLPGTTPFNGNLGDGNYDVPNITPLADSQWTIDSIGTAQNQNRHIWVKVLKVDTTQADAPIICKGTVDEQPNCTIIGEPAENQVFDFFSVFKVTKESVCNLANNVYIGDQNAPLPVDGITWVTGNLKIEKRGDWKGSGLLIVDGDMQIDGGTFEGIIWVSGNLNIINASNTNISGTIFVEGAETVKITGGATVGFDSGDIEDAATVIISWREVV